MGPTNTISYLIQHLASVISKDVDQTLQEQLGIGFSQYKILMVLEWNPRVQQKSIAKSLGQTEASISRQIKLLEKKGLISTKIDPNNKRVRISTPSILGMQITEAAAAILRRSLGPEFAKMGEDQQAQLIKGLQALHASVCRASRKGSCDHPLGV